MNKAVLMGRLTRDPDIRYTQADPPLAVARFTLAVDRRFRRNQGDSSEEQTADFISCVAFGKQGEFVEKYAHKGTKFCITGRIQTGSYTNKEGQKVYTTDVVVEEIEFAESKNAQGGSSGGAGSAGYNAGQSSQSAPSGADDDFMNIPDEIDEELPFN